MRLTESRPRSHMRESQLLDQLESLFERHGPRVVRGIGDDAAVVRAGAYAVISTDAMVDGVHFRSSQLSPEEIGHRALAGALSDLAAMGGAPSEAYLVLGVPEGTEPEVLLACARSIQQLAAEYGVSVAGGDVITSPCLTLTLTVVGWTADPGALVGRGGARPGDLVAVTGSLGGAGAGLALLDSPELADGLPAAVAAELHERYAHPRPRLEEGRLLSQAGATSMIDISDGLATDASHIAARSGVRVELSLGSLPVADGVEPVAAAFGLDHRAFAATAGDDYELCVSMPVSAAERLQAAWPTANPRLTWVGAVVDGPAGVSFTDVEGELVGYEHAF